MVLKLEISDILPTSVIIILMSIINGVLGYRIGYIIVPIQLHHSKGSGDDICRCLCRRRLVSLSHLVQKLNYFKKTISGVFIMKAEQDYPNLMHSSDYCIAHPLCALHV